MKRARWRFILYFLMPLVAAGAEGAGAQTSASGTQGDSVVLQGGAGEVYIAGLPPGWRAAAHVEGMPVDFAAWTPRGQTGSDWREMVAAQLFAGLGGRDPGAFLDRVTGSYDQACASISTTPVRTARVNGLPAAFRAIACGRNSGSGYGEVVLLRAVAGRQALYLMERIFRVDPFPAGTVPIDDARLAEGEQSLKLGLACQRAETGTGEEAGAATQASPCPESWKPALDSLSAGQAVTVFPVGE